MMQLITPICKYCSKSFDRQVGLAIHVKTCKQNPDRVQPKNQYTNGVLMTDETKSKIKESLTGKKLSVNTRGKISTARIRYLKANPDKVPYLLNHYTNGQSYPEKYWELVLRNNNVAFEQEKRVSIYRLDFAIGNINLEIDGEQHYLDPRILASNQRRDEELRLMGWKVLRVRWSDYQRMSDDNKQLFVDNVLKQLVHRTD